MNALDNDALSDDEQLLLLPPTARDDTAEILRYTEDCFIDDVRNDIHTLNERDDEEYANEPQMIEEDEEQAEEQTVQLSEEEMLAEIMRQIEEIKHDEARA